MAAPYWKADYSGPLWASQSCAEKGVQNPAPPTLRREPSWPSVRAVTMSSWFIVPILAARRALTPSNRNREGSIYPSWGSDFQCPEQWTPGAVTSSGEQSSRRDAYPSQITEEGGSRERQPRRQGSSVGKFLLGVHISFKVVERTEVFLMDHLVIREDKNRVVYFLFKTYYNGSSYP